MDRRTLLTLLGATAASATAGCIADDSDDSNDDSPGQSGNLETALGEIPGYADWIAADTAEATVLRINFERAAAIDSYDLSNESSDGGDSAEDLQLDETFTDVSALAEAYPTTSAIAPLLFLGFFQITYQFLADLSFADGQSDEIENPVMTAETITLADNAAVLSGPVDQEALRSYGTVGQVGSEAGYTIYGSSTDGTDPATDTENSNYNPFAVDDNTIIIPSRDSSGEDSANRESQPSERELLTRVLESESASTDTGAPELNWLLERCGDGALVFAGDSDGFESVSNDDSNDETSDGADLDNFGIEEATVEEFETLLLDNDVRATAMVVDDHENGRVTRSGFAFADNDSRPDSETLADLLAPAASDRNVLVAENRIVVEAFWE